METLYDPRGVEERWQQTWESEGLYNAESDDPRPNFAIARSLNCGLPGAKCTAPPRRKGSVAIC